MPPYSEAPALGIVLENAPPLTKSENAAIPDEQSADYNQDVKWHNVIAIFVVHLMALYGVIACAPVIKFTTLIFLLVFGTITAMGVTAGAHRLWTHRSYKAKLPLRIVLMLCFATSGQNKLQAWVRDHRVHHKYSETPADPHNANRGLFFSHMGWLMKKKHPSCLAKGKKIDMSDVESDPVVRFFDRNFVVMKTLFCFVFPMLTIKYGFGEDWFVAFYANIVKYVFTLNGTWAINSFAHTYGDHPYDKSIGPTENFLAALFAFGEGWHNFHHTFPWDYRTAESGVNKINMTANFIDFFARLGWAYDLKSASKELILRQAQKRGDGTRFVGGHAVVEAHEE